MIAYIQFVLYYVASKLKYCMPSTACTSTSHHVNYETCFCLGVLYVTVVVHMCVQYTVWLSG